MPVVDVKTLSEDGLEVFSRKNDKQLLRWPPGTRGLFIAESVKVIDRALDAGMCPYSLFVEDRWLDQSRALVARVLAVNPEAPVFRVDHGQMRAITGYQVTRGPLGAFYRPEPADARELCRGAHRVAVLEDITNYTNVGAIFRSAAALGIDAVLVTPSCHDPLFRRAARVSMGTVFQVPWARIGHGRAWAAEGVAMLHELGFAVAALALDDGAVSLADPCLAEEERLALVLGTEGDGLAASTIAACDVTVKIPMEHGVDSLNVAAASAVAFWELCERGRSRSARPAL